MRSLLRSAAIGSAGRGSAITGVAAALFALVLAGCGQQPATDTIAPPGKTATPLRLAYGKKIHYAPQIVALKRGYFADAGLAVEGKAVQAGIQAAEALSSGSADVAVMGDAPAIIAAASGAPVRIVASYGGGERMHRLIASATSGIRSPAGLKGKRIGVQMGSSTHGGLLLYLEKRGLSPKDLTLVPLDPSDMPEAMIANQIDAGVGSEPWPSNIEERVQGSYEVATLSRLGNTYPLAMLVTERYAREHPEAVVAALKATQQAVDFMHGRPMEAAEMIASATGVPVERERTIMDTLDWGVVLDDTIVESLKRTAEFLHSQGKISIMPDWGTVIDRSFVERMDRAR